jgi:hypothetical protein
MQTGVAYVHVEITQATSRVQVLLLLLSFGCINAKGLKEFSLANEDVSVATIV